MMKLQKLSMIFIGLIGLVGFSTTVSAADSSIPVWLKIMQNSGMKALSVKQIMLHP